MLTVLCRHEHSEWQNTAAFLYVIRKSTIMLTWKYIIVLDIIGKHNFKLLLLQKYLPTREQTLTKLKLSKIGNSTGKFKGTIMYIFICEVKNQLKIYDIQVNFEDM